MSDLDGGRAGNRELSDLDDGRAWLKEGLAGDGCADGMMGIDRFILSSCALVVVGSGRRVFMDGRFPRFLTRLGVDGAVEREAEGVDGAGMLETETDECGEWPLNLDCGRRASGKAPPLSDTGSRPADCRPLARRGIRVCGT